MSTPARCNTDLDLVPTSSHNAAGMLLPTREDPFTPLRDRWAGKGQSETGSYLRERLWMVCGRHTCAAFCHDDCAPCEVRESVRCWGGKEEKQRWFGRFWCDVCARFFDCGIHQCEEPCHRPSPQQSECPRSPSRVTHCPCGKSTIAPFTSVERSQHTFTVPQIPSPLAPPHARNPNKMCSHPSQAKCHTRPRPPCTIETTRSCGCGRTTRSLPCHQIHNSGPSDHPAEESEVFCDRPCTVLRACYRHQCRGVC